MCQIGKLKLMFSYLSMIIRNFNISPGRSPANAIVTSVVLSDINNLWNSQLNQNYEHFYMILNSYGSVAFYYTRIGFFYTLMDFGFGIADLGFSVSEQETWVAGCELRAAGCGLPGGRANDRETGLL